MANFFKASNKKQTLGQHITLTVERLNLNGCGVGKYQNKAVFIDGVLPKEKVEVKITEQKSKYFRANLVKIHSVSKQRVTPKCKHFSVCGGCDLQHLNEDQHLAFKKKKVIELFARQNINHALPWQTSISRDFWHYRRKARIGVQYNKLGQAIIGFRQKSSNTITPIQQCPVLTPAASSLFPLLNQLLNSLSLAESIGHIEVIDNDGVILIVRQLTPLNSVDKLQWQKFAEEHRWRVFMHDGEKLTAITESPLLQYNLPMDIKIGFTPKDFIQINHNINVEMVNQAMAWLNLQLEDNILDLFCGLGNFTLPIAKQVNTVVAVEGIQTMVDKAQKNAELNGIENCQFFQSDLNANWLAQPWSQKKFDKVLLDPARAGAYEAIQQLVELKIPTILYVSCDPDTLARDCEFLLQYGYNIEKIAIMDMFSQTKHIETMVLFIL